ncbi:LacI family transcriptional regulator [Puniceicoccaceae bacterium K14]|nr:LacI family transcriptional regulator [Puniceicoccaceae bacterium K14]
MGKILKVTMQDVAKALGLSQSTVSLALRNNKKIPEPTRKRIIAKAEEMGYKSGAQISTLMARIRSSRPLAQNATIAAITHHQADSLRNSKPVFKANWKGASQRAKELGYQLEEFKLDAQGMTPARLSEILRSRNIEGLLIFPFIPEKSLSIEWKQFSAVTIGYNLTFPQLNRVTADRYGNIRLALAQTKSRGYKRPGIVIEHSQNERTQRRWVSPFYGYGMDQLSDPLNSVHVVKDQREATFKEWIERYQPDVILGCGLLPVKEWLDGLGLKVPQDIGLVSVSDAFFFTQKCSRVCENNVKVGSTAIDFLVAQLHRNEYGIPKCRTETFIPGKWIEHQTL